MTNSVQRIRGAWLYTKCYITFIKDQWANSRYYLPHSYSI